MATKVLSLDIENLPPALTGLGAYRRALVLFRFRGCPVAQATLTVNRGRVCLPELHAAAAAAWQGPLWQQKLHAAVGWDERGAPDRPLPPATVAVCTRDRPADLERCLTGFMALSDVGQEYLVVDSCPATDATARLVAEYGDRVRYVREPRPGLNVARNRALREARYDIVAFNDDDAVPDPRWLAALLRNFTDPAVMGVTGLTMPLELETAAQECFERYAPFGRGFRRRLFYGTPAQALRAGHVGAGANMALRRRVLQLVGPFDEALDAGTPTRSGGDTEMFARLLAAGYHIVYDPAALSWHRHRRSWPALRRVAFGYGVGMTAVWTRRLLVDHQPGVLLAAGRHLLFYQLPLLGRALLRRPGHLPAGLLLAELAGGLAGGPAYLMARRRALRDGDA